MEPASPVLTPRRKIGRPLSFDRDAALEQAMLVFWRHGYETSSISDLTRAMGITAPSLYAAFGDKKQIFLQAVRRYAGDPKASRAAIERAPTAHEAARTLLFAAAIAYTADETPPGCLLASATASGSASSADVQAAIAAIRAAIIESLQARIERDIAEGVLPERTDAAALARFVMTVLQGLSVMARDGLSRPSLIGIVETALRVWPGEE